MHSNRSEVSMSQKLRVVHFYRTRTPWTWFGPSHTCISNLNCGLSKLIPPKNDAFDSCLITCFTSALQFRRIDVPFPFRCRDPIMSSARIQYLSIMHEIVNLFARVSTSARTLYTSVNCGGIYDATHSIIHRLLHAGADNNRTLAARVDANICQFIEAHCNGWEIRLCCLTNKNFTRAQATTHSRLTPHRSVFTIHYSMAHTHTRSNACVLN